MNMKTAFAFREIVEKSDKNDFIIVMLGNRRIFHMRHKKGLCSRIKQLQ